MPAVDSANRSPAASTDDTQVPRQSYLAIRKTLSVQRPNPVAPVRVEVAGNPGPRAGVCRGGGASGVGATMWLLAGALVLMALGAGGHHATAQRTAPGAASLPLAAGALRLVPASGPTGTVVSVSGTASRLATGRRHGTHLEVCWSGCATGMVESHVAAEVSARGHFTLRFTVPATAWFGPDGPHPLVAGKQTITIPGTTLRSQLSGVFKLTGPGPPRCGRGQTCASIHLTPDAGPPGTRIRVSGWVPLIRGGLSLDMAEAGGGNDLPLRGTLEGGPGGDLVQTSDGRISGAFVLPPSTPSPSRPQPGVYRITVRPLVRPVVVASASLSVTAQPTWAQLGPLHPLWIRPARRTETAPTATAGRAAPGRVARCAKTGIQISTDGGRTWSRRIPTTGATRAITAMGLVAVRPGHCASVTLDPQQPRSVYAAFRSAPGAQEGNLARWVGLQTRDGGARWTAIPVPERASPSTFGRFLPVAGGVAAMYGPRNGTTGPPYILEQTTDGGASWTSGHLRCPNTGPCVRWGPAPHRTWPGVCNAQPVLWSADGGARWREPTWPQSVCYMGTGPGGPYALATLSPTTIALIGAPDFPLLLSPDGGRHWKAIALPQIPGRVSRSGYDPYPGLTLRRNGSLTAGIGPASRRLSPGGTAWTRG